MQLSFPFSNDLQSNFYTEKDFLFLAENLEAVNFLRKFFGQTNFSTAQFPSLIIKGEEGSGKTHLLTIFAQKFSAEFLQKDEISEKNLADFFLPNRFYFLENVEEIQDEKLLLALVNSAFEASSFLILTTRSSLQFQLKDLASRLKNIFTLEIKNPSHESVKQLLTNQFSRRQIKLSREVIDFISNNIERTYAAILDAVKLIEFHCQESGKNLTLQKVKQIFEVISSQSNQG